MARYADQITENWQNRFRKFGKIYEHEKWSDITSLQIYEIEAEKCMQNIKSNMNRICWSQDHCDRFLNDSLERYDWKVFSSTTDSTIINRTPKIT